MGNFGEQLTASHGQAAPWPEKVFGTQEYYWRTNVNFEIGTYRQWQLTLSV